MSILDTTYISANDYKFQLISKREEEIKELVDRISKLFESRSFNLIVYLKNARLVCIDNDGSDEQEIFDICHRKISFKHKHIYSMGMTVYEYIDYRIRTELEAKAKLYVTPNLPNVHFIVMPGTEFSYSPYPMY